ncbi:VPLPA-CTERM sorting domain-containing protein [Roseovarius aestuariivivens]|uniref:VPLPA-CTERM sorting domain-containing protein n=1 Tax=Roseovarius aestuariivivens TaxID=1888910 RepID=UPI001081E6A9|nr:VPLPA-CTERM sorting domain-containing protein [Roseovarius aestuariivivens]
MKIIGIFALLLSLCLAAPIQAATVVTGYTYEITPATTEFATVQAPSFFTVPDSDGYYLTVGSTTVGLGSSEELDFLTTFGSNPTVFQISGIDPALQLDPADPLAFPLGVSLTRAAFSITISITPITQNYGTSTVIPLPAGLPLLLTGLGGLAWLRRRQKKAAQA